MYFRYIFRYSFGKERGPHLNKLKSLSPRDCLCQVWLKLARWFWRRWFLKVCHCIFAISLLSLLVKGMTLHLNKLKSPLFKDALCYIWLKLAQWLWKCEKLTDGRRTTGDQKISLQELLALVSLKLKQWLLYKLISEHNLSHWIEYIFNI